MIQRRTLLKTGAVAALGAPALSGLAQQAVTLKFHTFMSPSSNVWLGMHKPWMEKIEKESGGRIKFEGYPPCSWAAHRCNFTIRPRTAWSTWSGPCQATPPDVSAHRGV